MSKTDDQGFTAGQSLCRTNREGTIQMMEWIKVDWGERSGDI